MIWPPRETSCLGASLEIRKKNMTWLSDGNLHKYWLKIMKNIAQHLSKVLGEPLFRKLIGTSKLRNRDPIGTQLFMKSLVDTFI